MKKYLVVIETIGGRTITTDVEAVDENGVASIVFNPNGIVICSKANDTIHEIIQGRSIDLVTATEVR